MKRLLLAISIQLSVLSLFAADITPEEALDIANSFVQHDRTAQKAIRKAPKGTKIAPSIAHRMPSRVATNKDNVYIVNLGNDQGFVVVSGEDGATAEILGYCDHGSFDINDAPIQFLDLLNEYSAGIDSLRQNPELAAPNPRKVRANASGQSYPSYLGNITVEPLLTTTWNQWAPYNNYCPIAEDGTPASRYGGRCPSGCTNTAVTQVMNYWKWPKQSGGQIIVGYTGGNATPVYEDFPVHVYDWDNMLDDYESGYTSAQAHAVAQLMADVGRAMGTSYHYDGSPSAVNGLALAENFGYEPDNETAGGKNATEVITPLKAELDAARPVIYTGYPEEGDGHALVCDGYTSNNYFHFNYGWGGYSDGFYQLASIPYFKYNVSITTNLRPYEAEKKVIGLYKFGLYPTGKADIIEYLGGGPGINNGAIVLPDSVTDPETDQTYAVTHIRQMAFYRKGNFSKFTMGDNIEAIDRYSFVYARIDTLVLSDKMEVVPEAAFENTYVKHLTIGRNIRRIGAKAFYLCTLSQGIVCKSDGFEVERESFAHTRPVVGDWSNHITRIHNQAFVGARFSDWLDMNNLEVLEDSALYGCSFGNGSNRFKIGPKVREISPSAFDGWNASYSVPIISVDSLNPYFSSDHYSNIYNKDKTRLYIALYSPSPGWPETLIKMEPKCVRGNMKGYTVPPTVVDMEGAFSDCKVPLYDVTTLKCPHLVPPAISDGSISDEIFSDPEKRVYLDVPAGTEGLYASAPGWRKFGDLDRIGAMYEGEYTPLPPQDLNYRMVVHSDSVPTSVAVSDVNAICVSENTEGEAIVTMRANGRTDIVTKAAYVDSITFRPGFVYEGAEIFELNDSNLTVEAQKCAVTFDATTLDDEVELCVRNSVLLPRIANGITGGIGIDLSLSDGTHQLSGTAQITVPMRAGKDEAVCAAYFNEQSGEWDPVFYTYDSNTGNVTVITSHLSNFCVYKIIKEHSKVEELQPITEELPAMYDLQTALNALKAYVQSPTRDYDLAEQVKSDMGFWQSVGLDCFYNGVISVSEPMFNFKPSAIDDAVTTMGKISQALTIIDVVRADLNGDQVGVAAGTLKFIINEAVGELSTFVGTPVMAASMSMVAFIGIALDKFGTSVAEHKVDQLRGAYRLYYQKNGHFGKYRSAKDWFDIFYPVIKQGGMNEQQLNSFIETTVRDYCNLYWGDTDAQSWCKGEAIRLGITTYLNDNASNRQTISDEFYAELMNGVLVSVFNAIRMHAITDAHDNYIARFKELADKFNGRIAFDVRDMSRTEGQDSQYSGWKIGFNPLPDQVTDKPKWQATVQKDGTAKLGWFTIYALMQNGVSSHITLSDADGKPAKVFDFDLTDMQPQTVYNIDLAGGLTYDLDSIPGLILNYDPVYVEHPFTTLYEEEKTDGSIIIVEEDGGGSFTYVSDTEGHYRHTRFRTEIERFFNRHAALKVDTASHSVRLGSDIVVQMDGDDGVAFFEINTSYRFTEKTLSQFIKIWNDANEPHWYRLDDLLNGTMKHQIACKVEVHRIAGEDHDEYQVTYTGEGAYDLTAVYVDHIHKVIEWYGLIEGTAIPQLKMEDIGTGTYSGGGEVTLEYKTTLK